MVVRTPNERSTLFEIVIIKTKLGITSKDHQWFIEECGGMNRLYIEIESAFQCAKEDDITEQIELNYDQFLKVYDLFFQLAEQIVIENNFKSHKLEELATSGELVYELGNKLECLLNCVSTSQRKELFHHSSIVKFENKTKSVNTRTNVFVKTLRNIHHRVFKLI